MAGIKISPEKEIQFKKILHQEGFEFLNHQHAFWRAKKNNSNIIFYKKGTLLIQAPPAETQTIEALLLKKDFHHQSPVGNRILGLDESGKGDCFGPLVLAAALVPKTIEPELQRLGVSDSKKLTDQKIASLSKELIRLIPHQIRIIFPKEYNALYEKTQNLNRLMTQEYQKLIQSMKVHQYDRLILDNYSLSKEQKIIVKETAGTEILIVKQAESYPSVAAASILARNSFVEGLKQLSQKLSLPLPKGSGREAQKLFQHYRKSLSAEEFSSIAKTHFKI